MNPAERIIQRAEAEAEAKYSGAENRETRLAYREGILRAELRRVYQRLEQYEAPGEAIYTATWGDHEVQVATDAEDGEVAGIYLHGTDISGSIAEDQREAIKDQVEAQIESRLQADLDAAEVADAYWSRAEPAPVVAHGVML